VRGEERGRVAGGLGHGRQACCHGVRGVRWPPHEVEPPEPWQYREEARGIVYLLGQLAGARVGNPGASAAR
jgi:hypothetical protein